MSKRRPQYLNPQRTNAGIVMPEFVLHPALLPLVTALGRGDYARDAIEEPLFPNLSRDEVDACFHKLQDRPPGLGMEFPAEASQLPFITVVMESMPLEAPILADDAGEVPQDVHQYTTPLVLVQTAVGGETEFVIPTEGELVTSMVDLEITRGGNTLILESDIADFTVDSKTKTVTLAVALQAGDTLTATRYASYGLEGGDLFGQQYRFNSVIFVDTENPTLTAFLVGLVWRELVLGANTLRANGLVDLEISLRRMSLWQELAHPRGWRTEMVVTGLCDWVVYERVVAPRSLRAEFTETTADDDDDPILVVQTELYRWSDDVDEE